MRSFGQISSQGYIHEQSPHQPVLMNAVLDYLRVGEPDVQRVIDGTLGAGGHTAAMLARGVGQVLGLDVDPVALQIARANLQQYGERALVQHGSYADMASHAEVLGWGQIDGVLLDLGVSSMQMDTPERGFAFSQDGPLDMRFDPEAGGPSAADLINTGDEKWLADVFYRYGEERHSRRIARAIVAARPVQTTGDLAVIVADAIPKARGKSRQKGKPIHPATRVFQALRIAVNDELGVVERALPTAIDLLRPGGRLAVISFHSLEDRIVKRTFKDAGTEVKSPPGMMLDEQDAIVKLITRKPVTPDEAEAVANPRSRSAKLRVVEKL